MLYYITGVYKIEIQGKTKTTEDKGSGESHSCTTAKDCEGTRVHCLGRSSVVFTTALLAPESTPSLRW